MNVFQLERLADQGDVDAMLQLVTYYVENDELEKAVEWADRAAAEDDPNGHYRAMALYSLFMDQDQDRGDWKKLYLNACEASSHAASLMVMMQKKEYDFEDEDAEFIRECFRDANYYTSLSSYLTEGSNLRYAASHIECYKGTRERMLWLMIIFEADDNRWTFEDALACLNDEEYAAAEKTSSEEIIYALAAMCAATHHKNLGAPDRAVAVLDRTISILTDPIALDAVKKDRAHYRKRLFGGWKYKE